MTHLYIELDASITEEVSTSLITKLYNLSLTENLDNTSYLKGKLHTTSAPYVEVEYLNLKYLDLSITADKLTLTFEDPEILRILETKVFNTDGVTNTMVRTLNLFPLNAFYNNKKIIKFNELKDFISLNYLPMQAFYGCSNLEEITFPPTLLELPLMGFTGCGKLKHIDIPDSVTSYLFLEFWGCVGIEGYIIIPHTVNTISRRLFSMSTWDASPRTTKGVFMLCSNFPTISTEYNDTVIFGGNISYKVYLKYAHYNLYLAINKFYEGNPIIRPFKLFRYTSSDWVEITNPTQAQVREALNNISEDWTQLILPVDGNFPSNPEEGQLSLMEYSSVS